MLGNHDWRGARAGMGDALEDVGVTVLEDARCRGDDGLWVAGVGDYRHPRARSWRGRAEARARRRGGAAARHDPDVFPDVPARVALTVAGHLHGGQVNVPLLRRAVLPTRYGERYLHGHVVEGGRHLYVSSGVARTAGLPLRLRRARGRLR